VARFGVITRNENFSDRVREVVSVEHDPQWFEYMRRIVSQQKRSNCRVDLITGEREEGAEYTDPSDPFGYVSSDDKFRGYSFKRYVNSLNEYKKELF